MTHRIVVSLCAVLAVIGMIFVAPAQNPLPQDPKLTCTVTKAQFAQWYANGMIQPNDLVNPADSLNFSDATACNFYKWSWQMFLWASSPQHQYGGNSFVFDSPMFYDVSPPTADCTRTFAANTPGRVKRFNLFRSQVNHRAKSIKVLPKVGVVETEGGQATGDVLMTQKGSLVYYGIHVNDVYAYFLTGNKTGGITPALTSFPDSQAELKQVTDFATAHGKKLLDAKALVIELKTSWVEAATLTNPKDYLTMSAEVPLYTKTPAKWTPTGKNHKVQLALVAMHVVGTVKNHPEMVWATFEHVGNAPNAKYTYTNKMGNTSTVAQNTAGSWLFCKTNSAGPFNKSHMRLDAGGNIVATMGNTVSPSDTLRSDPWGQGTTANNTEIISLNDTVLGFIPAKDVRKNYVLIGALWTNGKLPGTPGAVQKGSLQLANATMETYIQAPGLNCFTCHQGNGLGTKCGGGMSHIYGDLQPLKVK